MKKAGGLSGISAMPRELNYPVMKGDRWHDLYDLIRSVFILAWYFLCTVKPQLFEVPGTAESF